MNQSGPIKDFALGIYDGPHATPAETNEGPVYLGIPNVTTDGRLDLSDIRHISEQEYPKWIRRATPQKDDLVFSYEATLHRYALIPDNLRCCLGRRMCLVRPDTEKVYPRFLLYYFLSSKWRAVIESNIVVGATVERIPIAKFPDFEVTLPPLDTQCRIADILSAYDDLIENNRRRIDLLEQSARYLYKEWFVSLRFPGHEHVKVKDGVPQGWKSGKIEDLGEIVTGKTPSTKEQENFDGDIPFVKTPDMHTQIVVTKTEQQLSERGAKLQENKFLPKGAVMVSCIGTVGVVAIAGSCCQTNQQINSVICHDPMFNYYAYYALLDLKPRLESMSGGVTMPNVNKSKFSAMPIMIPDKKIVSLFDEAVASNFIQIETLSIMNEKLQQARDLLLPRLMNGEIPV